MTSRDHAIAVACDYFDSGRFRADLARRVGFATESQVPERAGELARYLDDEIAPALAAIGFRCERLANPALAGPLLVAERIEDAARPTVLMYGHGDVVKGYEREWREGLAAWSITVRGDRWYGRGSADNKGQHSIVLGALAATLAARGRLGFNAKLVFEMGEEVGSPGLERFAATHRERLRADVFIACDGPRVAANRPTLFLGSRGILNFTLSLADREGGHHSGNWGGALRNPATVIAHAVASLVTARGALAVPALAPPPVSDAVRRALADIPIGGDPGDPAIDPEWGEPGLTTTERVIAWNSLEVLALDAGNPENPVNAIPPHARAHCQLRFVVGTDWRNAERHLREHLDAHGLRDVTVQVSWASPATRLDPEDPWVRWAVDSIARTTGKSVAILPNLGGTLPNEVFAETLGLPTLWVPHSYPGCSQHAANEHLLGTVAREGLAMMAGLFWDLGERAGRP